MFFQVTIFSKLGEFNRFYSNGTSFGRITGHDSPVQFSSVAQSGPTLCDPMHCSTPGFPVHHQLPEVTQTHVYRVNDAIQPSHPVIPFSSHLQSFPVIGSFQMSQFFASGSQSIEVSASASVLPMNIQDWFPLGWIGWISFQSKRLSRVFSNTTVQKHRFFSSAFLIVQLSHTYILEEPQLSLDRSLLVK